MMDKFTSLEIWKKFRYSNYKQTYFQNALENLKQLEKNLALLFVLKKGETSEYIRNLFLHLRYSTVYT